MLQLNICLALCLQNVHLHLHQFAQSCLHFRSLFVATQLDILQRLTNRDEAVDQLALAIRVLLEEHCYGLTKI